MPNYVKPQWVRGNASRQAHCDLPEGTYEREISGEGFFGPAAMIHHQQPPTGWTSIEGPLRPHLFDLRDTPAAGTNSPFSAPVILANKSCEIRKWVLEQPMQHLARNADGDQLLFIHQGSGALYCDFGHLALDTGDYVILPRGTQWRLQCDAPMDMLMVEASGSRYTMPDRGLVGHHAVFDQAMFDIPEINDAFRAQQGEGDWVVEIKKCGELSRMTFAYNPLDAVGWHGDLSVLRLNVRDIRPLMSHRYHLPPSAHTTFLAERFVICTFAPRPFETDEGAVKVPFFHSNDDYDEVLFYHAGDFFSRDDIDAGMMTLHPAGFPHGPHPKALSRMFVQTKEMTDEYAVMIDTRDPLEIGEAAGAVEVASYVDSWKGTKP